jgi:hypothetical protein
VNTDATRAHIDAETMAAWADRALPADAAAAVELHLSNCERCQEVLAAFVRSAPEAGAVVIPFWARRPVQWSAAGLAAAAALVALIWIGRPPAAPTAESTVASRAVAPSAPSASAPSELRQDKPAPVDQIAQPSPASQPSPKPAKPRQEKAATAAELRKDRPASTLQDRTAAEQAAALGRVALAPPPPPSPAAVMPPVAPPATTATVTAAAPVVAPAATPVVTPVGAMKPAAMAESVSDAFSAVIPIVEIAAPEPSPSTFRSIGGVAGRGGGARALNQTVGATRWRIVAGTRVERTIDAGATWTPLPIEPELKTLLLAGSATSPTNCWLVGRDGVVLVTNDGRTFRRVSVPEVVHLTGVTAIDGMRATVTAIDGRKFSTSDGGQTWK